MILSIDLGTTYFKISLFDREGRMCDTCRIAPPTAVLREGWMELSCEDLADTVARGIGEIRARDGGELKAVEAVTFATQTNSFALLDAADKLLTPMILWPDRRAEKLDKEVGERCNFPEFSSTTGFSRINFQCMPAKLLWLMDHSPYVWKKTKNISLIGDYLTLLLTGERVIEAGAAGLTGFADIHRCRWYREMLERFGIDERLLPAIVRAGTDLGRIDPGAANRFGLPKSCRFVVGCLDQYAGAIGVGNVERGTISETTGTVLATVLCTNRFAQEMNPSTLQGPGFREGLYWRMTFGQVSANYLEWLRDQLPDRPEFEKLLALAESVEPGAEGLRLRTEAGMRIPDGVFGGLNGRHSLGHRVRCILEAVAYALHDQIYSLVDALPREIRCAGGAARSELWLRIKADVLGIPAAATFCPEPTSLGAAVLAQAAIEKAAVETVAHRWVRLKPPHRPNLERHEIYRRLRTETT